MAKNKFRFPLAYVKWEDAYSHDDWIAVDEAQSYDPCIVESVGWLVDHSEKHVTIIQSLSSSEAGSRITIPTSYIRIFQTLMGSGRWKTEIDEETESDI